MRLLHTSDWHLGRSFHGFDRVDAQRAFLDHLVDLVRDERVDAVLVAGDVYDRAIPSLEAVELLEDGLARLSRHATVIVSSGNHDSARRLGRWQQAARQCLHTTLMTLAQEVLLQAAGPT